MIEKVQRRGQAKVYPDMWVDPDDDPRNSEGPSPDGELETYRDYLTNYRLTLVMKCQGLDPQQLAQRSVPPSTLSQLGLVRHVAQAERDWRGWITEGDAPAKLYGGRDAAFETAATQEAVDGAHTDLAREQAATDAALDEHADLGQRLGAMGIAVREVWVHRIEEYARHCGHADLLRECIDGRVGQ